MNQSYIFRLNSAEMEKTLRFRRVVYAGITRGWAKGSRILFMRKTDEIIGYGVIAAVSQLGEMDPPEQKMCAQRNWSVKISFGALSWFVPAMPSRTSPIASQSPMTLHGSELPDSAMGAILKQARAEIIT